jgi:hypothetical protein
MRAAAIPKMVRFDVGLKWRGRSSLTGKRAAI